MARQTFEAWIPEEYETGTVIAAAAASSAIETLATKIPMGSDTKKVPRSGAASVGTVAKGSAYGEDEGVNDEVILVARKLGRVFRIAEEDVADSLVDILDIKRLEWTKAYARHIDNACLAVTAAENGGTVPFTSVYRAVRTTNAATGYTADDNHIATAAGAAVSYDNLSDLLGLVEAGNYVTDADTVVIAHPSFKGVLRGVKDSQGNPIFLQGLAGTPDTIFGYQVAWSQGARTSAVATADPTGNPLMIVGSKSHLMLGVRSGPESIFIPGRDGASALTDEDLLKMRSRRGFVVGHESAFAVLEKVPAV